MFNFLRTRFVSIQSTHMSMCTNKEHSIRICSFCNVHHLKLPRPMRNTLLRHYATTDTLKLNAALKKKIKYRSKKYAELLEVRNQKTNNTRAAVHKLNSFHMSTLLEQPDITLDKLHKITNKVSTKDTSVKKTKQQNFKNEADIVPSAIFKECNKYLYDTTEFMEDLKQSGMNDNTSLIKDSSFLTTLQQSISKIDNKNVKQDAKMIKYEKITNIPGLIPFTKENFDDSLSDHNLISQILAYMDVYIQTGMLQKAQKMLTLKQLKHNEISIKLYNMLMDAYVSRNMQLELFSTYKKMKAHSVQPNAKTYTLLFHMGAKIKNRKQQAEILMELIADMKSKNISFDDMMNTIMSTTRRNNVLQCIRLVDPKYQIQYRDIDNVQNCKLLQKLTADSKFESPVKGILTMDELQNMLHTQYNMERQGKLEVKSIALFNGNLDTKQEAINLIAKLKETWKSAVTEAFERNLASLKEYDIRLKSELKILYPFLQVLPKEEYVDAILYEINRLIKGSDAYSEYMSILYYNLGNSIYKKYEFQRKLKAGVVENLVKIYKEYLNWYLQTNPADKSINARVKWQQLVQKASKSGVYSDLEVPEWPRHILLNIGKFLYNIILNNVRISPKPNAPDIPALYLLYRNIEGRPNYIMVEVIKPHPFLHKLYEDAGRETLVFDTVLLPTCSPPRPWIDINIGGFLFSKTNFARDVRDKMIFMYLLRNSSEQLYPVFDSLNQLGSIPWKINEPILDILIKLFQKGGSEELNVPQSPSILPSLSELIKKETDNNKLLQLALQLKQKKNEMYSLWCDCLYKLSLANYFRGKIFWLPHNIDFRGRAYPIPPHLTHLSSDLSRSLLMFAQGKPLGPKGLDWLKIHTINLTGLKKKESTSKRLKYANEILDLIIDSARNPLTGKMWWNKSDEPWQTLAACKEIDNALQSPNVEEYVSHFPIHQDGSCNGLQHYAALGRDQIGAESVNLYPSSTPQDVYSVVVSMVEQFRKTDAEAGNQIAKVLEGFIIRKVIKQTVMTTVYGVTKFGARIQIARQLSDLKDFDQKFTWSASLYLVEQTFKALRTMFTSAKEIQDWFTECSRVISTRCNQYVQWVTPLGLPVLQPYYKRGKSTKSDKMVKKPDTLKQKNAFPPNFIHSLDSCHMMLTSLHCEQAGITFVSVHDCFWTHPCSVNIMSKICREQFVALHNEPILEDLSIFFKKRYEKHFIMEGIIQPKNKDLCLEVFENLPKKGKFDINNVLSSEYFFS